MPRVIVLPRCEPGVSSLADAGARAFAPMDLRAALIAEYDWDAHFALYDVEGEEQFPRVNKPALALLRAAGASLRVSITALDYDRHDLPELTDALWNALVDEVQGAAVPPPTYMYRTSRGCRILYCHEPLEPEDAEGLHQGLLDLYAQAGIVCDPDATGWNRTHRLPRVKRDDGRPQPPYTLLEGLPLEASTIKRGKVLRVAPRLETLTLPRPLAGDLPSLWVHNNGGVKLTEWAKEAKRRLADRQDGALAHLFDPSPPPVPDPRNKTLMQWLGCMSAVLIHLPETTPQHLYALLEAPVAQSLRNDGRDLHAECWKMLCYCWAREEAKHASLEIESQELADTIVAAVRKWPTPPPEPDKEWILRHAVVGVGSAFYVLQADGYYSRVSYNHGLVHAGLRDSGLCPALIDLSPEGKDLSEPAILNRYCTALSKAPRLEMGPHGGWLDGNTFVQGAYHRRTDLEPIFDQRVDQWLRKLAGPHYATLNRWIGLALAIERGPICALSLVGPPGSGKGMFAQALAECFSNQKYAQANVFGTYQYGVAETPVIFVDEGWPPLRNIPDTFRRLVGGTSLEINRKHEPIFCMDIAPRLVLAANNGSVVSEIFKRKQLTADDERALWQRLLRIEIPEDASPWLARQGGRAFTHAWVKDTGVPSRYVVAKHFMHLYATHGQSGGASRFLMEGTPDAQAAQDFAIQRDEVAEAGQALVAALAAGRGKEHEGQTWVRSKDVQDQHESLFGRRQSVYRIHQAIQPFTVETKLKDPKFHSGEKWERGRPIDMERLTRFADDHGLVLPAKKLDAV